MTPDTSAYMIAGFFVIFVGILAYVISIFIRAARAVRQVDVLNNLIENKINK